MRKTLASLVLLLLLGAYAFASQNDKLTAVNGIDPSASGTITSKVTDDGNVHVKIDVKNLAPPSKLVPAAQEYVVWIQPEGAPPQELGEIKVDKNQNGSITGTSPAKNFEVLVSAENTPNPLAPSNMVVLRGNVQQE